MISVKGMDALMLGLATKPTDIVNNADKAMDKFTASLADEMSDGAPVATGLLKATVRSGFARKGILRYDIEADLDTAPYMWRQNFEHKSKRYFITRPALAAQPKLVAELQKAVDNS